MKAVLPVDAAVSVAIGAVERDIVHLLIDGHPITVRWLPRGSLGAVRTALAAGNQGSARIVLMAPVMSAGARALAQEHQLGWLDETGAARITTPNVLVSLDGAPRPPTDDAYKHWTPTVQGVAEALLIETTPTVDHVVKATGVSVASASRAMRFLADQGLLTARAARGPRSGRVVADRSELLERYADATTLPTPVLIAGVLWRDPIEGARTLGEALTKEGTSWAVTGALTAALAAPVATVVAPLVVYVDANTEATLLATARAAGLQAKDGGRLALRPFPSPVTKRLSAAVGSGGIRSVSLARAYADLRSAGVRGEEAAEGIREMILQ